MEPGNGACDKCGTPFGKRRRCYRCSGGGLAKTGEDRQCATCGSVFYVPRWKLNDRERNQGSYCSRECKHEALRKYAALGEAQKQCTKCGHVKPLADFSSDSRNLDGKQAACKECVRQTTAEWREKNPEKYEALKRQARTERQKLRRFELHLEKTYGITLADYQAILAKQNDTCAICRSEHVGRGARLHVDHCHQTGRVRGLLCGNCNTAIGLLKEDPVLFEAAVRYLREGSAAR